MTERSRKKNEKPICFVISPIGPEHSEIRTRSDFLLKHVIEPALIKCRYIPLPAKNIPGSGAITKEVIQLAVTAPLVIADLTGANPNVVYELALRHAVRKPFIQMIPTTEKIMFDVKDIRTIQFDVSTVVGEQKAKSELIEFIKKAKENSCPETPTSLAGLETWLPIPKKERSLPDPALVLNRKKRMDDDLEEFLEKLEAAFPEGKHLIKELKANRRVRHLKDTTDDLDAAASLVNRVPSGGQVSATSSLQHDDADERNVYRDALNNALKRGVKYRKIICCSSPQITRIRYETWLEEFEAKARLISAGSIDPELFQLLHYPHPMLIDVLIYQDEHDECREMVAGFAGGERHSGLRIDDPVIVKDWLDIYLEAKIIPLATTHTEAVLDANDCDCSGFLRMLENAKEKAKENRRGNK